VKAGLPVINQDGVVGQVSDAGPLTSTLLPMIHVASGIAGLIQVSRVQGTVMGRGNGVCSFSYVDRKAIVSPGELVVTSGLDRIFPKGLPVGRIATVRKIPNELFLEVELEPVVNFSRLEEILIMNIPDTGIPAQDTGKN
jgi:rod shape-determining protein MreC